jgi:hypothetical protein
MKDALHDDFAFEPIPGLPEHLPAGEKLLWQGAPEPTAFAIEVMRLRLVAVMIAGLVLWRAAAGFHDGIGGKAVLIVAGGTLVGGCIALALLGLAGWLMARGTIYSITSQRLVIRHGVAMPMAINIPFTKIASAAAAGGVAGSTSIALSLMPGTRSSLVALWPHARPWHLRRPEPSVRCIADGERVASVLAGALQHVAASTAVAPAAITPAHLASEAPPTVHISTRQASTRTPRPQRSREAVQTAEAL